ncbi:MAG TPA: hypothetical protein DCY27_02460 [Desulfobacterales bacterium]|nr:hypothetical protein [Desulfobacterales bacterium]
MDPEDVVSSAEDIVGATLDERFYIKRFLGEGGFGSVYHAEQHLFGIFFREVALKIFKEEQMSRALAREIFTEAIILAQIIDQNLGERGCRHLVQVYDIGIFKDFQDRGYIAMEYVRGKDLHRKLSRQQAPLPTSEILDYMKQISQGLAVLHSYQTPEGEARPIIHRDLKPNNIIISDQGVVKLVDFGLATAVDKILGDASNAGTIHCQAPESFEAYSNDPRSDIYSLGLVFYEMLTQKHPFAAVGTDLAEDGKDRQQYLQLQAKARWSFEKHKNPPSLLNPGLRRELAHKLDRVVLRCLSYYPEDRYTNAQALYQAILEMEEGDTHHNGPTTDGEIQETLNRAKFFLEKNHYDESREVLLKAQQQIERHRREEDFIEVYDLLAQVHSKKAEIEGGMGNFDKKKAELEEAVKQYRKVLRLKPRQLYYQKLARLYQSLGKQKLAEATRFEGKRCPR